MEKKHLRKENNNFTIRQYNIQTITIRYTEYEVFINFYYFLNSFM